MGSSEESISTEMTASRKLAYSATKTALKIYISNERQSLKKQRCMTSADKTLANADEKNTLKMIAAQPIKWAISETERQVSKKNKPKSDSMSKLPMPTKLTSPLSRTCKVALMAEKKLPINRTRPFMFIIQYDNVVQSRQVGVLRHVDS